MPKVHKHLTDTLTLPLAPGSARRIRCGGKTSGTPPTLVLTTCKLQQPQSMHSKWVQTPHAVQN